MPNPSFANVLDWHQLMLGGHRYLPLARRPFVAADTYPAMKREQQNGEIARPHLVTLAYRTGRGDRMKSAFLVL
jgi:hypothetical protein